MASKPKRVSRSYNNRLCQTSKSKGENELRELVVNSGQIHTQNSLLAVPFCFSPLLVDLVRQIHGELAARVEARGDNDRHQQPTVRNF